MMVGVVQVAAGESDDTTLAGLRLHSLTCASLAVGCASQPAELVARALAAVGPAALPALLDTLRGGYPAAHQLAVGLLRCAFLPAAGGPQDTLKGRKVLTLSLALVLTLSPAPGAHPYPGAFQEGEGAAGLLSALLAMLGERDGIGSAVAGLVAELVARDGTPAALQQLMSHLEPSRSTNIRRSVLDVVELLLTASASTSAAAPLHVDALLEGLLQVSERVELVGSHGRWRGPCLQTTPDGGGVSIPVFEHQTMRCLQALGDADLDCRTAAAAAVGRLAAGSPVVRDVNRCWVMLRARLVVLTGAG
jgi:hypothetical protein